MKRYLFFLFLLFPVIKSHSQDFTDLQSLEFKSNDDYKKYEHRVLDCSNYVLSVLSEDTDTNRILALQTIIKWMSGTPDYQFEIDESITSLIKKNESILGLYMASMTKFVLENKEKAAEKNEVKYNTYLILLDYCGNPTNNVKLTKELQKAIDKKNEGKLKEYLKI